MGEKNIIVISLGGSLIVPDSVDFRFLEKFKATLRKNYNKWKFVIVCGGGSIARKYIDALKKEKVGEKQISLAGIRSTRMNAMFVMQVFGKEANDYIPKNMKDIKNSLRKNNVVICGALRYSEKETSDGTAAKIARYLHTSFINITNVKGLYTSDPKKNKNARLITEESWAKFEKRTKKLPFSAGQHFVLDQEAASIIKKYRIRTYIIGEDTSQISRILKGEKFEGTLIWR